MVRYSFIRRDLHPRDLPVCAGAPRGQKTLAAPDEQYQDGEIQTLSGGRAFHITGWYDDLEHARRRQKLLIGPWGHGFPRSSRYGDVDFGSDVLFDVDGLHLRLHYEV